MAILPSLFNFSSNPISLLQRFSSSTLRFTPYNQHPRYKSEKNRWRSANPASSAPDLAAFGGAVQEDFSIFIPKDEVVSNGLRIPDVLMKILKAEVKRTREMVVELMPRIMYRAHRISMGLRTLKDVFDLDVEGTLGRIKSRLSKSSSF